MTAPTRARTLAVLWVTYATFYFCRANFGIARQPMQSQLALTALEVAFVLGAVKLGYAIGQLVNGQLTERFGAKRILGIGMLGSSAATLLLSLSPELAGAPVVGGAAAAIASAVARVAGWFGVDAHTSALAATLMLLAFANGWFQAGGWPPVVKVASRWFPLAQRGRTTGVLGTSYTVGSAVVMFLVGALIDASGGRWRIAFVVPAIVLAISFVHTTRSLREHPPGESSAVDSPRAPDDRLPVRVAMRVTLSNPRIWILALGLFGVDAVRYGFLDWAPGHLAELHHTGSLSAALKTAVFPLAGALGALSSGWVTDRFFQSRRAPAVSILLLSVCALTLAYRSLVGWGAAPTVACLALVGFCLFGAHVLLVGTAAQDFARRGAAAAAAGFVDFTGHVGAFAGDVVTGWLLRRNGWAGAIAWWAGAAIMASALVATLWRARPHSDAASASGPHADGSAAGRRGGPSAGGA